MSTTSDPLFLPLPVTGRRPGVAAWLSWNVLRLFRMIYVNALATFISLLGAVSTPGMRPVGFLQAWALRRMGVACPSSLIWIGPGFAIDFPQGVALGRRIVIGADARLTARAPIVIGDDFLSAPGLAINTGTHDLATLAPLARPVTIGPGVWCGQRVTICAGVAIGAGTIVGAGSVVVKDLPPQQVAVGVPCRPVRPVPARRPGARTWSNFRLS